MEILKCVCALPLVLAAVWANASGTRPYEFDWANRTADDRPVLMRLERADGWTVRTADAAATLTTGVERVLFGDGVMHLDYRGTGKGPSVRLAPSEPVAVPPGADTVSLWVYGNYVRGKSLPLVTLTLQFEDAEGQPFSFTLYRITHLEWFLVQKRLPEPLVARLARGGKFLGLTVTGGTNAEDRWIEFTSFAVYREDLKPLAFKPRAKRPNRVFPDAPAGVNTGAGELPFPNRALTVVPPTSGRLGAWRLPSKPWDWSDMAFKGPDGVWRAFAAGGGLRGEGAAETVPFAVATNSVSPLDVTYRGTWQGEEAVLRFHEEGLSLVLDLSVAGDRVREVRFGAQPGIPSAAKVFPVPYYSYGMLAGAAKRPRVACFPMGDGPCFFAAAMDWTQSNASEPFCTAPDVPTNTVAVNGGVRYNARTDGTRNPCFERFVWTFSREFADVLPAIPNPPSPHRALTAEYEWCHMGAGNREKDKQYWNDRKRRRLDKVFVGDHEVCMRDGNESFTFRTRPAPKKGGDEGMRDFTRHMIDRLGYLYGPYNNYTDFAPVNGYWSADRVARFADGNLQPAWNRCYSPKPVWTVEACEEIVPELQRKFAFNSGYCDVHTCVTPWQRCDYDARVPGAGTFAQTFYSYGELLTLQRKFWNGPVFSEGGCHFMYAGLDDGNFAQDQGARLDVSPWLVDFDLLRIHPLCNNFGMGYPRMFYGKGAEPEDKALFMDRFLAATIAFGHIGYFMTGNPDQEEQGYWMVQPIAAHYAKADVREIRYADADGRFVPTSAAIASGAVGRSQVRTLYADGTLTVVNGDREGRTLAVEVDGQTVRIPANGWYAVSGDRRVVSASVLGEDGHRADWCASLQAAYVDGRGQWFDSEYGATDGRLIRVFNRDGGEEVFIRHAKKVVLPYVAAQIVKLDRNGKACGAAKFAVADGRTALTHDPAAYSYRVTKAGTVLENETMRLLFRAGHGMGLVGIVSKTEGEVRFGADTGDIDFWQLCFAVPGEFGKDGSHKVIERSNRSPAARQRTIRRDGAVIFAWEGIDLPDAPQGLDVFAKVRLEPGEGGSRWELETVNRSKSYALVSTRYPVLKKVGDPGRADVLEPRSNLGAGLVRGRGSDEPAARSRRAISFYMGYSPMVTAFMQDGAGVYVAAHDPRGRIKSIVLDGQNSVWFETPVENAGVVGKAAAGPKYPVAVDVFRGDWWAAAKKYRKWALGQKWTEKGPIRTRADYPKAMSETPLWINIHGDSSVASNVLAKARERFPDFNTGLHWHRWNLWGHDSHYPEYFPTVSNVAETVAFLNGIGEKPMIYTNGRLWDAEIPSWQGAQPYATMRANGQLYIERYANKRQQGVMCPSTAHWQDTMAALADRITGELAAPGMFMDQIGAAGPRPCWNPAHGHALGGGTYWFDGYQRLLAKAHAITSSRGAFLTTEGTGETWMNNVDGYLCVTYLKADDVPFYPAVYSGYTTYFCSPQSGRDTSAAFWALQARQVLWGVAPGWFDPAMVLSDNPVVVEKRGMIGRLCRFRQAHLGCFAYGELLDELRPTGKLGTVRVTWNGRWSKNAQAQDVEMPAVIGSIWRDADGRTVLFAVNLTDIPQTVAVGNRRFEGRTLELAAREIKAVKE